MWRNSLQLAITFTYTGGCWIWMLLFFLIAPCSCIEREDCTFGWLKIIPFSHVMIIAYDQSGLFPFSIESHWFDRTLGSLQQKYRSKRFDRRSSYRNQCLGISQTMTVDHNQGFFCPRSKLLWSNSFGLYFYWTILIELVTFNRGRE